MRFLWPALAYDLALLPPILLAYLWRVRRRSRYAVHMSSLSLVTEAARHQSRWRRHLPFVFLLLALTSLLVALPRPAVALKVPAQRGIMILALDVSRRMCSSDIGPTRLQALERAMLPFVAAQGASTQIGLVAFSDFAELIVPPTDDRSALEGAIKGLMTGQGRAVGDGILESLDAIMAEEDAAATAGPSPAPASGSDNAPAVIVLVTSGVNDVGSSPLDAARLAAARGVRVYTVGLSSASGPIDMSCQSSDPSGFGGAPRPGPEEPAGVDANTLRQIAAVTGAAYFPASGLSGLNDVFHNAQLATVLVRENFEVTALFLAMGALLALTAFLLGLWWSPVS
jgi:Ca-activated chloride channel family protein